MLTFSTRAVLSDEALYGALEKKVAGAIRSSVSNCSHLAQSILVKAMSSEELAREREAKRATLEARAKKVQEVVNKREYSDLWEPYPFNSGYFMCLRLRGLDAESYRKYLLDKYGVGVIADGDRDVRVAFSAVDLDELPTLCEILAKAARELLEVEAG